MVLTLPLRDGAKADPAPPGVREALREAGRRHPIHQHGQQQCDQDQNHRNGHGQHDDGDQQNQNEVIG